MKRFVKAWGRLGMASLLGAAAVTLAAAQGVPPVEHYTRSPALSNVSVSPSGKRLAVLIFGTNGMRRLGVIDLDPLGSPRIVGAFDDADITSADWVTDDRLVFEAFQRGTQIRPGGAGTFAVNHDGTDERQLITWRGTNETRSASHITSRVLPYGWELHRVVGDGSNDVIVTQDVRDSIRDLMSVHFARLDTRTRELKNLSFEQPPRTYGVAFDHRMQPRMAMTYEAGRSKVFWRDAQGPWKEVIEFDSLYQHFTPLMVNADDTATVLVRTGDTSAIHRFDGKSGKLDAEPLMRVKNFDLSGQTEIDGRTRQLLGVHFVADRPMSYWFDERMQVVQKRVDSALPAGRVNRLHCGECLKSRFYVVRSFSDRQPGEYHLYDHEKATLQLIGASRPWIDEARQGRRSFHRYPARDGLPIPVVVTHPADSTPKQPLPTVVLVHGGPFVRGSNLSWQSEAQFLASRGYRVIEPAFRGTEGFGQRHFQAGWKEWGTKMIDDLADAVSWAAREGLTDDKRVCVMGGSYGGYAALMSPIAHPKVYRCAVSLAGVVDPNFMYDITWSDLPQDSLKFAFPVLMGDPKADAELLAKTSPLKRAAEIKVPVLLAHGGVDRRVPIAHARAFASAAQKAGVKVEKVEYLDEGHGFLLQPNQIDYLKRVEAFLRASLGTDRAQAD